VKSTFHASHRIFSCALTKIKGPQLNFSFSTFSSFAMLFTPEKHLQGKETTFSE
jgi:hypothetical protein